MDVLLFYPTLLIPTLYKPHTGVFLSRNRDGSFCVYTQSECRLTSWKLWIRLSSIVPWAWWVQHPAEGCRGNIPCALCAKGWWSCWIKQLLCYSSPFRPGSSQALILSLPIWIAVELSGFTFRQECFYHYVKELPFQWCWKIVVLWSLSSVMLCPLHTTSQIT